MLDKITGWATGIHTIVWARAQMFLAVLWAVVQQTDVGAFLQSFGLGRWVPLALFTIGLITEFLRRYKADDIPKGT